MFIDLVPMECLADILLTTSFACDDIYEVCASTGHVDHAVMLNTSCVTGNGACFVEEGAGLCRICVPSLCVLCPDA